MSEWRESWDIFFEGEQFDTHSVTIHNYVALVYMAGMKLPIKGNTTSGG